MRVTFRDFLSITTVVLLAGNLWIFGRIAAGIGQIGDHLAAGALTPPDPVILKIPIPGDGGTGSGSSSAQASGNVVNVGQPGSTLRPGPRTVEQVADYLGVTADTIRESYIPVWILDGHMDEGDRSTNRWMIPDTFTPYRPK
jgi:hypothetical protein